jgi:hypothetical protein
MKYIYYILTILLVSSLFIAYQVLGSRQSEKKAVIIINDRVITPEEFERLYASRDPHQKERGEFINTLITKELLIQEAKKSGIDQEEPFRQSIQNYYEQSLIKLFLDRRFASLHVTVSDEEVSRYAELMHKKLHVTINRYDTAQEAGKAPLRNGESRTLSFEELSKEMKCAVLSLREGQSCGPHLINGKYVVLKLDRIEESGSPRPAALQPSVIRKMLLEEKKEEMLNDWLDDLKKRARIKIMTNGSVPGERS